MPDTPSDVFNHGLHHVAVRTADFDRSIEFYTEILEGEVKFAWGEKPERAAYVDLGQSGYIELFERLDEDPPAAKPAPAILHYCIRTPNCDAAVEKVRAAGYPIKLEPTDIELDTTTGPSPMRVRIAFVYGPSGEELEFLQSEMA